MFQTGVSEDTLFKNEPFKAIRTKLLKEAVRSDLAQQRSGSETRVQSARPDTQVDGIIAPGDNTVSPTVYPRQRKVPIVAGHLESQIARVLGVA
jgi:hypothetical protein